MWRFLSHINYSIVYSIFKGIIVALFDCFKVFYAFRNGLLSNVFIRYSLVLISQFIIDSFQE
jgi:uncharacterized membrane protein YagU involved in acid resistance